MCGGANGEVDFNAADEYSEQQWQNILAKFPSTADWVSIQAYSSFLAGPDGPGTLDKKTGLHGRLPKACRPVSQDTASPVSSSKLSARSNLGAFGELVERTADQRGVEWRTSEPDTSSHAGSESTPPTSQPSTPSESSEGKLALPLDRHPRAAAHFGKLLTAWAKSGHQSKLDPLSMMSAHLERAAIRLRSENEDV